MPGKYLYTVDALPRALVSPPDRDHVVEDHCTERFVADAVSLLPANEDCLHQYRTAQHTTTPLAQISLGFARENGLTRTAAQDHCTIVPYWQVRGELTLHDDLLLCGRRIVVPSSLRKETLDKIHSCHQGIHFIHC